MKPNYPLAVMALRLFFGVLVFTALSAHAAQRNIVFFVADDLSPDLGCYGNPAVKTPHMDLLATESTLFKHAYATTASCSASRSTILTGLHNHANGQLGHTHNYHHFSAHSWVQSLPVLLRRLGYRTGRVGKFHVAPEQVFDFDEVIPANGRNPIEMAERSRPFIEANSGTPFFLYMGTDDPHRSGNNADELPHRPDRFGNPPPGSLRGEHTPVTYNPADVIVPSFLPDTPECRAELAQYYQSTSRVDQGIGRLRKILEETGNWDNTLVIVTSDHGMAFAGAKTTVYEAGLRVPLIVRNPYQPLSETVRSDALVTLLDITPTLVDFAGGLDHDTGQVRGLDKKKQEWRTFTPEEEAKSKAKRFSHVGKMREVPYTFHGKSLLPTLGKRHSPGWDAITASHTFHEIQMYYPMRVYRDREYKLIWNIAYESPYPFASDLWTSPTWQSCYRQGPDATYGFRKVSEVMRHRQFELFDMRQDPEERVNLAENPEHADALARYIEKLKAFQRETGDPWMLKWTYD